MFRYLITPIVLCWFSAGGQAQDSSYADQILNDLGCGACHEGVSIETDIQTKAPDLSQSGMRYSPAYLFRYMRFPVQVRQQIGLSRMPTFRLDERESLALALYLLDQLPPGTEPPSFNTEQDYETARAANPGITAETGERIFVSLNCVGCHVHTPVEEWEEKTAPDLSYEGARVNLDWLRRFLDKPTPLRSSGFFPGSGSRMPDFRLTPGEREALVTYALGQTRGFGYPSLVLDTLGADSLTMLQVRELVYRYGRLSRFSQTKASDLLRDKQPCLGCHRLGNDGGRIGPDLSSLDSRLWSQFSRRMLRDPKALVPSGVMPRVPMADKTLDLIEHYLLQQQLPRDSTLPYMSLIENPPNFYQNHADGEALYVKYCAACHGVSGDADGFNAQYLPVVPTQHSDAAHMETRPDDTLFDGIFAGGYILNKSNRMPPWGFTLERREIWSLVEHLRELCQCEGPAWSRDNRPYR